MESVGEQLTTSGNSTMATTTRGPVPEADQDFAAAAHAMLRPFTKEVRHDMPLQLVLTFLSVARYPGKSVGDYAEMEGVSKSVMSRHLLDLGERNRKMEPGFGLVGARPHPMELRRHEVFLTPKGRALLQAMARTLDRTHVRKGEK